MCGRCLQEPKDGFGGVIDTVEFVDGRFCSDAKCVRKFAKSCSKDWAFRPLDGSSRALRAIRSCPYETVDYGLLSPL
jgi:hypothetical protein